MTVVESLRATLGDRYSIEREIGAGGMAVYLARDLRHERDIALQVLKPELGVVLGSDAGRRYIREDLIALMWSSLGENDRALRWYERALQSNSAGIGGLYVALANEGRRRDPRILVFAKRAGLPDPPPYWR